MAQCMCLRFRFDCKQDCIEHKTTRVKRCHYKIFLQNIQKILLDDILQAFQQLSQEDEPELFVISYKINSQSLEDTHVG